MVAASQKQQHNASIAHTKTQPHNHRANKKAGLLSLFSLENSLVLASASSRFLPFLSSLCLNPVSPPSELFSSCLSCDVLRSISRELPVYLSPSHQCSSRVHALLCLNWWNVRGLVRFFFFFFLLLVWAHARFWLHLIVIPRMNFTLAKNVYLLN